jgi:hypothetical protein
MMATQRMTVNGRTMYRDSDSDMMRTSRDKPNQKKKGSDGKACWEGYRYGGTNSDGSDKCIKVKK